MDVEKEKLIKCFNKWLEQKPGAVDSNYNMLTFLLEEGLIEKEKIIEYVKDEKVRILEEVLYRFDCYASKREIFDNNFKVIPFWIGQKQYYILKEDEGIILTLIKLLIGEDYGKSN